MQSIGELIHNIRLNTEDAVIRGGFTQVPNSILRDPRLSLGAKVAYAMFLSYAWHNNSCFPGQERLALDMGMSRSRVTEYIGELQRARLVTVERRGQGKTNNYTVHFRVGRKAAPQRPPIGMMSTGRHLKVDLQTARSLPADHIHYEE